MDTFLKQTFILIILKFMSCTTAGTASAFRLSNIQNVERLFWKSEEISIQMLRL